MENFSKDSASDTVIITVIKDTASHTVIYDANGATEGHTPIDSNKYFFGDTVTVLDNTGNLAKEGYTFAGWDTLSDGSGFIYTPGKRLALNGLVKYFILNQEKDILLDREMTFRGVNLSVGLTYKF